MPDRHSASVLVIPLRSLTDGKQRLAGHLCDDQRAELIQAMADAVMQAAQGLEVLVVHDDPAVETWANTWGARSLRPSKPGLNVGLEEARALLRSQDTERMIVVHGDLPFATSFAAEASLPGVVLVPDTVRNGTNVFSLPTQASCRFSYGDRSFEKHLAAADSSGFATTVVANDALSHDVDEAADMTVLIDHPNYRHIFEKNEAG